MLLEASGAVVINGETELMEFVERGLSDIEWRVGQGQRAQAVVRQQLGALRLTNESLVQLIRKQRSDRHHQKQNRLDHQHRTVKSSAATRDMSTPDGQFDSAAD